MDESTKRQHQLELGRQRAKRFYAKHRDEIVVAQRVRREQVKEKEAEVEAETPFEYQFVAKEKVKAVVPKNIKQFDEASLKTILDNDPWFTSEASRRSYKSAVHRIFQVCDGKDLISCLKNYVGFLKRIETDIYPKTGEAYSTNTLKSTFQSILFLLDHYLRFKMKEGHYHAVHSATSYLFDKYIHLSQKQNIDRQTTHQVPTFEEYSAKCLHLYGLESKQYLLALLYSILPVRDNFCDMTIIDSIVDDDDENNFLILSGGEMIFKINKFKTRTKYLKITYTVNQQNEDENLLYTLMSKWIYKKRKMGGTLFGKSPLSTFVSEMNSALGYENMGGINLFRHIAVSQQQEGVTFEESKALSDKMGHSLFTQGTYRRRVRIE